ncbi:MAG: prepilin-type N-terminal cleavage/methylation domain-containing protein, partial [Candidatus Omnitrophica bacterium]|nr:prepilin-type N-terminal cleavage/methylation domain-containing protein [Candidatus Omnitrophota bacterium]
MRKGYSLIEVLVSVAILTILAIAVYDVLLVGQDTFYAGIGKVDLQAQVRLSFTWITRELREAGSFNITALSATDDRLSLDTPNEIGILYYRDITDANGDGLTTQVIREYPSGTRRVVANSITSLTFTPSGGNTVTVSANAEKSSGTDTLYYNMTTKV